MRSLDGASGFAIPGGAAGDHAGYAVGAAGDVDGDGIADLLVGAYKASAGGAAGAGKVYLVHGALSLSDECTLQTHSCQVGG